MRDMQRELGKGVTNVRCREGGGKKEGGEEGGRGGGMRG